MKKLTKAQLAELRRLYKEPQNTYGSARARVQNNLVLAGLAQFSLDGALYPPRNVVSPLGFMVVADQCVITAAGRTVVESGISAGVALPDQTGIVAPPRRTTEVSSDLGFNEVLLHVYWTTNAGGNNHFNMLNKVSADLGLTEPPSPPFTREEMEKIMFAAKMAALKCVYARKRKR